MSGLIKLCLFGAFSVFIGACASGATIEESVPQSALVQANDSQQSVSTSDTAEADPVSNIDEALAQESTADKNGRDGFPNLNVRPQPAGEQLTDSEKNAGIAELTAAKANQAGQGAGARNNAAEMQRLKILARTHAGDALKEIEAKEDEDE